jgi:hypothetical protein
VFVIVFLKYRIKVSRPIEIISIGFDGPLKADAIFDVQVQLMENYGDENHQTPARILAEQEDLILAKRERTFYIKFDNPVRIQANIFYKLCYSLKVNIVINQLSKSISSFDHFIPFMFHLHDVDPRILFYSFL